LRGTPKNLLKTAIFGPPEAFSPLLQHPFSSLFLPFPPFSSISEAPANSRTQNYPSSTQPPTISIQLSASSLQLLAHWSLGFGHWSLGFAH